MRILLACLLIALVACKKKPNEPINNSGSDFTLKANAYVVDSAAFELNNNPALISQNKFQFAIHNNETATYKVGDVIVVSTNGGYIKRIMGIENDPGSVTYTTTNADMEDVIENANFSFNISSDSLKEVPGFTQPITNVKLLANGITELKLDYGNISFDPNWKFDFDFDKETGIKKFEMSCDKAALNASFDLSFSTSQKIDINRIDTLKKLTKTYTKWVPVGAFIYLPVVVVMDIRVLARSNINLTGGLKRKVNISSQNSFSVGMKYEDGLWDGIYSFTPSSTYTVKDANERLGYSYDFYLYPEVSVKLYNVAGPYASVALRANMNENIAGTADWDQNAYAWLETTLGADVTILGKKLANYSKVWKTDSLNYNAPYQIKKVSGDGQTGKANKALPLPVKVKIEDSRGVAQANVPVYFAVTAGGGSVSPSKVLTDTNGFAQTIWTIGNQPIIIQYLTASAKKADGTLIKDAPVDFAATVAPDILDPLLAGTWKMDLEFGESLGGCHKTLIEDEGSDDATFHFNTDGTVTFDTDPLGHNLNGNNFTNTYTYANDTLKIRSNYLTATENTRFEATLVYNSQYARFEGNYTNTWTDNKVCAFGIILSK